MKKEVRFEWNQSLWPLRKHNHLIVKFAVSLILMGVAFRLFSSRLVEVSPVDQAPFVDASVGADIKPQLPPLNADLPKNEPPQGKCDLFIGDWIPNPSGPIYTNESCHVIEHHQDCTTNGRPDSGYLYWRWKPRDCDIPRFDAKRFLELMKDKTWALVGDSISRNHVQSWLCILSEVETGVEVYHDKEYKSKRWYFPSYNFTLSVIWSPFLVKAVTFEDINGVSTSEIELHLDKLDSKWVDQYQNIDYMIFSGGQWFLKTAIYYENNTVMGCHYCPGKNLTELGIDYAYRKALQLVFNFVVTSNHKAVVLFRSATPDHFEGGEWFSGGKCQRTVPYKDGEASLKDIDKYLRGIEMEEFEKAAALASENNLKLKLFDTTHLSLLRPDGHPGPYRHFHPFAKDNKEKIQNDCLHWCLPGPIDSWSDLVMAMIDNLDSL